MQSEALLSTLHTAEKLKGTFRHCQTANGHPESVAAHSWRLALLAYFIADEYPDADMNKVPHPRPRRMLHRGHSVLQQD